MTPEQAERIALWLEMHGPGDPEGVAAALAASEHLRRHAQVKRERVALWQFNAWTGTLIAADPGEPTPRIMGGVPRFAAHVPHLLDVVGCPCRVSWWGERASRAAVHAQRSRLADRLEDHNQNMLAAAVRAIVLEQVGRDVLGRYEPQGLPTRIAW